MNSSLPDNLPVQVTSFVGREREIEAAIKLLDETRLLTLTGAGGVGKTRLSLEIAGRLLDVYQDGVCFVELEAVFEPELVVHKVSSTLGRRSEASKTRLATLQEYLREKEMLLVIDNCEHLVQACAELVAGLLPYCPELRVLATSREALGVRGETVFEVPPLSLPPEEASNNRDDIDQFEATQLFIERAKAFQPRLNIDGETALAIAQICLLLEGIPLAIELAAARVRILSASQIKAHLRENLDLLPSGGRTVVSRQQTLNASIEWSYKLLNDAEQMLFRRLAVFSGRFTLEDVAAVCAWNLDADIADAARVGESRNQSPQVLFDSAALIELISKLVNKSLVSAAADVEMSYRMLNPIHQFALEKLRDARELSPIRNKHFDYYFEYAEQVESKLRGVEQSKWQLRTALELDNLTAALEWSLRCGEARRGLRMASNLSEYWWRFGYGLEGLAWFKKLLASDLTEDEILASALVRAGHLAGEIGDYEQAKLLCEQSLALSQKLKYQEGIADARCYLGVISHFLGEREKAVKFLGEGVVLFRQLGEEWHAWSNQLRLSDVQLRIGNLQEASDGFEACLAYFKKSGDKWGIGFSMGGLGDLARLRGEYKLALEIFRDALFQKETDNSYTFEAIAITLSELGSFEPAARLWGFAEAWREKTPSLLPPSFRADYAPYMEKTRTALGEQAFRESWNEGHLLSLQGATALAIQPLPKDLELSTTEEAQQLLGTVKQFGLTKRELEVLQFVATGLTDAQVGEQLFISPRTVSKHLQSIYRKIQVKSRSAATRFALEHHIV